MSSINTPPLGTSYGTSYWAESPFKKLFGKEPHANEEQHEKSDREGLSQKERVSTVYFNQGPPATSGSKKPCAKKMTQGTRKTKPTEYYRLKMDLAGTQPSLTEPFAPETKIVATLISQAEEAPGAQNQGALSLVKELDPPFATNQGETEAEAEAEAKESLETRAFEEAFLNLRKGQAVDFYCGVDFKDQIEKMLLADGQENYKKLILRCMEEFNAKNNQNMKPTKGKITVKEKEVVNLGKKILKTHLTFMDENVEAAIAFGLPATFYTIIEALINSTESAARLCGLKYLTNRLQSHSGNQEDPFRKNEWILINKFLVRDRSESSAELVIARQAFEEKILSLQPGPKLNFSRIAASIKDLTSLEERKLAIHYFLGWLKTKPKLELPSEQLNATCESFCKIIAILSEAEHALFFQAFKEVVPSKSQEHIQKIYSSFVKRAVDFALLSTKEQELVKLSAQQQINVSDRQMETLHLFCNYLDQYDPKTLNDLYPRLELLIAEIGKQPDVTADFFLEVLKTILEKELAHPGSLQTSYIMNPLFKEILKRLPEDEASKKETLTSLCAINRKAKQKFDFKIETDRLLLYYLEHVCQTFNEQDIQMALTMMESHVGLVGPIAEKADQLMQDSIALAEPKIPIRFFKACIEKGMQKFSQSNDIDLKTNVFANLVDTIVILLRSQETPAEKLRLFDLLLPGLSHPLKEKEFTFKCLQEILEDANELYEGDRELYWMHRYNLYSLDREIQKTINETRQQSTQRGKVETELTLQRSAITKLIKRLANQNLPGSIALALLVLKSLNLNEFKEHLDKLVPLYQILFKKLREYPDQSEALQTMSDWLKSETEYANRTLVEHILKADSIFSKLTKKEVRKYNDTEGQAHRIFMLDVIKTFEMTAKNAIEEVTKAKLERTDTISNLFFDSLTLLAVTSGLEIIDIEDLNNFNEVLKIIIDFSNCHPASSKIDNKQALLAILRLMKKRSKLSEDGTNSEINKSVNEKFNLLNRLWTNRS